MTTSITISKGTFCKSLLVTDTTDYSPLTREDYGVALFVNIDPGNGVYVNDSSLSDLTSQGITGTPDYWDIAIANSTLNYEVTTFYCKLWVSGTWTTGDVVYYPVTGTTGFWYKNGTGTGTETPSGTATEWAELDGTDYTLFLASLAYTVETIVGYIDITACPAYMIVKKECVGNHCIIVNTDSTNAKRYGVTYYNGDVAIATQDMVIEDSMVCFILPEDNVYIITIEEDLTGNGDWSEVAVYPIYEICKLQSCATYLFDSILCNEFDPCCNNCSEDVVSKQTKQRLTLNQMIALYGSLLAYINEETIEYLGITDMADDRLTYLERINSIFTKMKAILERCDLCQGAWQALDTNTVNTSSSSYKPCNC